jgi:transposase
VKQEKQSIKARTQNAISVLTMVGVDIGKDIFRIVGFGADGKIALRRKIKRLALAEMFKKLPPCIVGMEACQARRSWHRRSGRPAGQS